MSQQRPYEGFAYPTEYQAGGDTYYGLARATPPSSGPAAATTGGSVGNTGLTRRSAQHTSQGANTSAGNNSSASMASAAAITVALPGSNPSPNAGQLPGTYNYFHNRGGSIEVNSGYNSDAGSSVSNPLYVSAGSGYPAPISASSRQADAMVRVAGSAEGLPHPATGGMSPLQPPSAPRFMSGRQGSTTGPPTAPSHGVFHAGGSEGHAGSAANSTLSSGSGRPPIAPPTFLPSRPFIQTPPLSSSSPAVSHPPHHPHSQQPYVVPMPSSMQSPDRPMVGTDPLGGSTPAEMGFVQRPAHMVSPSTAGPRMPASSNEFPSPHHSHSAGGVGGAVPARGGGLFSRLLAQVIPALDDGSSGAGGAAAAGEAAGSSRGAGPIQERPPHQLRFGNPADDLPLLEELGIFPRHILDKARAVLNPFKAMSVEAAKDTDLAGPVVFALSLALLLSLRGKIQFSAIYGLFVLGVGLFKLLLSLMQPKGGGAPLQFVVSTVGYGLLPTVLLALVRTTCSWLLTRRSLLPLTLLMILWSAWCGTALVAKGLGMEEQRFLVLYPMLLFYAAFDALTVF